MAGSPTVSHMAGGRIEQLLQCRSVCFLNCILCIQEDGFWTNCPCHCNTSVGNIQRNTDNIICCHVEKYSYLCFHKPSHSLKKKMFSLSSYSCSHFSSTYHGYYFLSILLRFPELEILLNIFLSAVAWRIYRWYGGNCASAEGRMVILLHMPYFRMERKADLSQGASMLNRTDNNFIDDLASSLLTSKCVSNCWQ